MRRLVLLALPLMLLSACGGDSGPAPLPTPSVRAGFAPRGLSDVIEVDAVDRLPLSAVLLVAPDGSASPSGPIDVSRAPRFSAGQYVANDPWRAGVAGSTGTSILAPTDGAAGAALRAQAEILTTFSHASLPLPDSAVYRQNWRGYRIRLAFGTLPGQTELREIPAPEPPPAR